MVTAVYGCAVTLDPEPPPPGSSFDFEARLAQIATNGGVYVVLNGLEPFDVLLRIDDPASGIYGASISIPASAVAKLNRALLSLEPHLGPALSTSQGQTLAGPAIDTALVDAATGGPISFPDPAARIDAPYNLTNFPSELTVAGIHLGTAFSAFAAGLTNVTGRQFGDNPDTVAGQVAKFGIFVAYHDGSGGVTDDTDDVIEPPDPSTNRYALVVSDCNRQSSAEPGLISKMLDYSIIEGDRSRFKFSAKLNGTVEAVNYRVDLTGPLLELPTSTEISLDPGYPDAITAYDFLIGCVLTSNSSAVFSTRVSNEAVSSYADLETDGVLHRNVEISHWYTKASSVAVCGIDEQPCTVHIGKVRVKLGAPFAINDGLELDDGLIEGKFTVDMYINARWEVLND